MPPGKQNKIILKYSFSYICFLFSEGVEQCIPWAKNTTQQIDLAFNIFFMVYFFIRVSFSLKLNVISTGPSIRQRLQGFKPASFRIYLSISD